MKKAKSFNAKSLYFSDRLTQAMDGIFDHPLTIVEAPMGYGKTTAVKEYLNHSKVDVLWQTVYDNLPSNFWKGFSRLFAKLDEERSQSLFMLGFPDDSVLMPEALDIIEDIELTAKTVLVLDDFHLIESSEVNRFIEFLALNEITNLHIVLIMRYSTLPSHEELKLKSCLHHIAKENFELTSQEIAEYYKLCGIKLNDAEVDELYALTEGWISALYLLMLNYIAEGSYSHSTDIYKLVEIAVYLPFSDEIKDFFLTMCIFDSFTLEQAVYMHMGENTGKLLTEITNKNAFVKYDRRTKTYHMHNIFTSFLKDVLESKNIKMDLYHKAAQWYAKTGEYNLAVHYFYECGDFENLLLTMNEEKFKGVNIVVNKELLIKYYLGCPEDVKARHHFVMLLFAIRLFFFNEVVLFGKVCNEFIRNLETDETLNEDLKNKFLGEFELLLSFTKYNDITKMSEHHKKACVLLKEPSSLLLQNGNLTFGSPSVLYLFYRESGKLEEHVKNLIDTLPYYSRLTAGNGLGAEYVMEAEWYFNTGDLENAEITLHKAFFKAQFNAQIAITTCAMFLQMRIALFKNDFPNLVDVFEKLRENVLSKKEYFFIHTMDICEGYIYSLLKQNEKIPKWIIAGSFNNNHIQFPVVAMLNIVYGRTLLINGEYLKLIGYAEHFIGIAAVFPNLLGTIYTNIYLAAANKQIFRESEALSSLKQALDIAMPDRMYMPFVENCDYIGPLLEQLYREGLYRDDIPRILELATAYLEVAAAIINEHFIEEKPKLTERELEIAQLAAEGLTNKEIGARLFISENTVKTQLKNVFEKLGVNSRALLKQVLFP